MARRSVQTGAPWEEIAGYARAVRVGNVIHVSGTTAQGPDGKLVGPGDPGAQTRRCLEIIERAIRELGGELRRQGVALSGDAGAGDVVDEPARSLGGPPDPLAGAGGGEEGDGIDPLGAQGGDQLPFSLLRRQVDTEHTVDSGSRGLLGEAQAEPAAAG